MKTFEIEPYAETTRQVVEEVFRTMLSADVHESSAGNYAGGPTDVTAAIFFSGEWKGATYIECTREQAMAFTQQLMDIPPQATIDSDTRDALGELVNMIGGNLKSALPKGVSLSLPCVMEGQGHSFHVCKVNETFRIGFGGAFGSFWVTVCTYVK
jgi:chemotaxis protein CheX